MPARELPPDLVRILARARELELLAGDRGLRNRTILATTRLMLTCLDAGWRVHELAPALGLNRSTAQFRVDRARRDGVAPARIDVPEPPLAAIRQHHLLATPAADRQWLTIGEVAEAYDVPRGTVATWRRAGLLPHTDRRWPNRLMYLRADVERVLAARRPNGVNINWTAARRTIG